MAQAPPLLVRAFIACVFTLLLPSLISAVDFSVQLCLPCLAGLTQLQRDLQMSMVQCEVDWVTPTGQAIGVDTQGCFKVKSSSQGGRGLSIQCSLEISVPSAGTSLQQTLSFEPNASSGKYVADPNSDKELELCHTLSGFEKSIENEAKKGAHDVQGTFNKVKNRFKKFHP